MVVVMVPHLGLSVIRVVPVGQSTSLQNKVAAIPHSISTDQLKHGLFTARGVNQFRSVFPTILPSLETA